MPSANKPPVNKSCLPYHKQEAPVLALLTDVSNIHYPSHTHDIYCFLH